MKKLLVMLIVGCVAVSFAGEEKGADKGEKKGKDVTKEQFVAQQQKMAEKKGETFDQAAAEAKFDKMDKNGDGVLTADEKGKKKGGKKKGEKPAE
jgi:hypothetical protein